MVEIELTHKQREAMIDALGTGVVEAIAVMQRECPELGDYVIRQLLLKNFSEALRLNDKGGIVVDLELVREDTSAANI